MHENDAYSLLGGLYQTSKESLGVARRANIPVQFIDSEGSALVVWTSIIAECKKRNMLRALQSVVEQDYSTIGFDKPFAALAKGESSQSTNQFTFRGSLLRDDYEKITGDQSTLLPIHFLATGLRRAKSVARVVCRDKSFGTGFLIDHNLFVTNNHVLGTANEARDALIEFGYELTDHGTTSSPATFRLIPASGFLTSVEDDWTVVRIQGDANTEWGAIPLNSVEIEKGDYVNIIQHPGGGPKQIGIYHNLVISADSKRIQYLTDTLPGSSGSPVFNSSWHLVGVHHAGGWLKQPGKADSRFCNEGIVISLLVAGISRVLV